MAVTHFATGARIPTGASAVTPSDTTLLPRKTVGIFVGTGGTVTVDMWGEGTDVPIVAQNGQFFDGIFKRVKSTGTTASDIVCFYWV